MIDSTSERLENVLSFMVLIVEIIVQVVSITTATWAIKERPNYRWNGVCLSSRKLKTAHNYRHTENDRQFKKYFEGCLVS